jgi:puromycin-sensitive aminopeptidase
MSSYLPLSVALSHSLTPLLFFHTDKHAHTSHRTHRCHQVPIAHAEEVEEVFDNISYAKGSCVVRMLHEVLGADDFRRGLQLYMQRHKYSNTETINLWQALEEASGKPVKQLMRSWTEQTGFPVVKVVSETWGPRGVLLGLRQSLFLSSGKAPESKPLWTVPIVVTSSAGGPASVSLHDSEEMIVFVSLPNAGPSSWIKLNAGHVVPARFAYTPALLTRLAGAVKCVLRGDCGE